MSCWEEFYVSRGTLKPVLRQKKMQFFFSLRKIRTTLTPSALRDSQAVTSLFLFQRHSEAGGGKFLPFPPSLCGRWGKGEKPRALLAPPSREQPFGCCSSQILQQEKVTNPAEFPARGAAGSGSHGVGAGRRGEGSEGFVLCWIQALSAFPNARNSQQCP